MVPFSVFGTLIMRVQSNGIVCVAEIEQDAFRRSFFCKGNVVDILQCVKHTLRR